jgi:hypothetical protein
MTEHTTNTANKKIAKQKNIAIESNNSFNINNFYYRLSIINPVLFNQNSKADSTLAFANSSVSKQPRALFKPGSLVVALYLFVESLDAKLSHTTEPIMVVP